MWTAKQRLVLTNTGSHDRMKPGFLYCPKCGRAEPNGWNAGKFQQGGHPRPNPDHNPHGPSCNGTPAVIVLGNEFETDIALFRFHLGDAVTIAPGSTVARIVLTTVAEALATAAAKVLGIEASDIGAEFRVAMTSGGRTGRDVEVYLYDLTPGGAGFVRTAAEDPSRLFDAALARLESCRCTHSCYECLRSYKNKWDHKYLDRKLGAAFIRGAQEAGVMATAKHFPGHGDTAVDSHLALPVMNMDRQRLDSLELIPFKRAIQTGVWSVMTAHLAVPTPRRCC